MIVMLGGTVLNIPVFHDAIFLNYKIEGSNLYGKGNNDNRMTRLTGTCRCIYVCESVCICMLNVCIIYVYVYKLRCIYHYIKELYT